MSLSVRGRRRGDLLPAELPRRDSLAFSVGGDAVEPAQPIPKTVVAENNETQVPVRIGIREGRMVITSVVGPFAVEATLTINGGIRFPSVAGNRSRSTVRIQVVCDGVVLGEGTYVLRGHPGGTHDRTNDRLGASRPRPRVARVAAAAGVVPVVPVVPSVVPVVPVVPGVVPGVVPAVPGVVPAGYRLVPVFFGDASDATLQVRAFVMVREVDAAGAAAAQEAVQAVQGAEAAQAAQAVQEAVQGAEAAQAAQEAEEAVQEDEEEDEEDEEAVQAAEEAQEAAPVLAPTRTVGPWQRLRRSNIKPDSEQRRRRRDVLRGQAREFVAAAADDFDAAVGQLVASGRTITKEFAKVVRSADRTIGQRLAQL